MRVALVQAPVWWTVDPPLGVAQVAGCAAAAGHEVAVFDLNILLWAAREPRYENLWLWEQFQFWTDPEIVARFFADNSRLIDEQLLSILRSDARVVGFSVSHGAQWASLELARRIKAEDPSRLVVWGGQFFFKGDAARTWVERPEIDAVVRGQGDLVFPALLAGVERAGSVEPAPGVLCKVAGRVVDGGAAPAIPDLDRVPFPQLSAFPIELYTDQTRIPVAASRGCVWKCRFCSSTQFWAGYSYMSGERIFAEVRRQKELFPRKGHLEFYDIVANGSVRSLVRFSELSIEMERARGAQYGWKINAIIRPEMTREVLDVMKAADCHDIIYGVESGSQRVLERMNKPFRLEAAERVLKDTHEAGIRTTANFMFGYPGETEEDFERTLGFLRKNAASLDQAYGSATFTSLEEHSYLTEHRSEFGIKPVPNESLHNLYWELEDGSNGYEVRLDRYRRFRRLAVELGIDAYKGVDGNLEQDHLANLAQYKRFAGDHLAAIRHYLAYLEDDLYHEPMRRVLAAYLPLLERLVQARRSVDKAARLLPALDADGEFLRWAAPHLNNGGLTEDYPRRGQWLALIRLLNRARGSLLAMPPESRAGIHATDGRLDVVWIKAPVPPEREVRSLRDRVRLVLALAEGELARGEDKKEAPVCRR